MSRVLHWLAATLSTIVGFALLAGILLGNGKRLPLEINTTQDIRTICLAVWSFLIPAWFSLEDKIWTPPAGSAEEARYKRIQEGARYGWTIAAALVCLVVGATPPKPLGAVQGERNTSTLMQAAPPSRV
jgi:hypothetical protein